MDGEVLPRLGVAEADESLRPVYFKVSRRVDVSLLRWWQRGLYEVLCRRLPARWRVPAVVPMDRGGFATFAAADAACTSKDDQLRVRPWNWAYSGDELDTDIVCRPRDQTDWRRYKALREKYADYDADEYLMITRSDYRRLMEAQEMITESKRRMKNALRD